ncbi:MAG: hypothetical protein ABIH82_04300 [Candidatus Woesearchaeota archaeon]
MSIDLYLTVGAQQEVPGVSGLVVRYDAVGQLSFVAHRTAGVKSVSDGKLMTFKDSGGGTYRLQATLSKNMLRLKEI